MLALAPLRGWSVAPSFAAEVVTPAYDALTEAQRAAHRAAHPDSYLHALPTGDTIPEAELQACRDAVDRLVEAGRFQRRPRPFVALYRLRTGSHVQTALLADIDATALGRDLVGHEQTREPRESDLARYLDVVGVTSSPVCVMHDEHRELAGLVERRCAGTPDVALAADDDEVTQQLWLVDDPAEVAELLEVAADVGPLVITDGHHRAAAARRFADRARTPGGRRLLIALTAAPSVRVREYNRVVRAPVPVSGDTLADALAEDGLGVTTLPGARQPQQPHELALVSDGRWWRVTIPPTLIPDDPADALDVALLQELVLARHLGVAQPRSDPRLGYVPGPLGPGPLAAAAGPDGVGFLLHPTDVTVVAALARAGRALPPKSTYVTPKARSGLLLLPRH